MSKLPRVLYYTTIFVVAVLCGFSDYFEYSKPEKEWIPKSNGMQSSTEGIESVSRVVLTAYIPKHSFASVDDEYPMARKCVYRYRFDSPKQSVETSQLLTSEMEQVSCETTFDRTQMTYHLIESFATFLFAFVILLCVGNQLLGRSDLRKKTESSEE